MKADKKILDKIYNRIDKLATKGKDQIYEYHKLIDEFISNGQYVYFEQCLDYYYKINIMKYDNIPDVKTNTWNEILFQTNSSFSKKLKRIYDTNSVYQMGYDVYSYNDNTIGLTISSPLSTTYSTTSSTQSVTPSKSGNFIYLDINDTYIYHMEIYKAIWATSSTEPSDLNQIQIISSGTYSYLTQSSYKSEIPITYGHDYLIRTYRRNSFDVYNYRMVLSRNVLLGQIQEVDSFGNDTRYYLQNRQFAKLMGTRKTFLDIIKIISPTQSSFTQSTSNDASITEDQNLLNRYTFAIGFLLS